MGFVARMMQRTNRNIMLVCILGALVVFVIMALSYRYLANVVLGPETVSEGTVAGITDVNSVFRYYVTMNAERFADSGIQYVSTSDNGPKKVENSYILIPVGSRFLLAKVPGNVPDKSVHTFTGSLVAVPADEQTEVISKIENEEPSLQGQFLPYMLDTSDFRTLGFVGIGVGLLIYALCTWGAIRVGSRMSNPAAHPVMRTLARYGDPSTMADQIDAEVASGAETIGALTVTDHWLVKSSRYALDLLRTDDVIWAYKKVTKHRTNGIPTGTTYSAIIHDRYGKSWTVTGKEQKVNSMLESIYKRTPWMAVGYSPEFNDTWKKNRQAFISAVDQRRQGGRAGSPEPGTS